MFDSGPSTGEGGHRDAGTRHPAGARGAGTRAGHRGAAGTASAGTASAGTTSASTASTAAGRGGSLSGLVEGHRLWGRGAETSEEARDGGDPRVYVDQPGGVAAALADSLVELDDDALVLRARELAGVISTAEASLALVAAEIDRRELPAAWECRTIERFAGWHLEMSATRARQLADVGRAMAAMPTLAEAVSDGTLSFDKAVVVARSADEASEEALVELATVSTVSQTQRLCGAWRRQRATDPALGGSDPADRDDDDRPADACPVVIVARDADGIELRARFDHVDGAVVLASLEAATEEVRAERESAAPVDPADERPRRLQTAEAHERNREQRPIEQWRGLGLMRLAEASLDEAPEGAQRNGFTTQVVLHIGVDTLLDPPEPGSAEAGSVDVSPGAGAPLVADAPLVAVASPGAGASTVAGAPPPVGVPNGVLSTGDVLDRLTVGGPGGGGVLEPSGTYLRRDLARFLACDAGLLTVLEDGSGDPLHLGPARQSLSRSVRRAMAARDRTCTWPGCTSTRIYAHHRHHRAHGGHDDVENVCGLCWFHHKVVHEHDIRIVDADDDRLPGAPRFRFFRPDGTEITASPEERPPPPPPPGEAEQVLFERHVASGADPEQPARWSLWHGDPLRLGDAVAALYARRDRALRRTRPT